MPIAAPLAQSQVFSEATNNVPSILLTPRPHFTGGQANLIRYQQPSERPNALLGPYIQSTNSTYAWPNRPANSLVDQTSVNIWLENAILQYAPNPISTGTALSVSPVTGYTNRIRLSAINGFKANGPAYPRLASFADRDVQPGDYARLYNGSTIFETSVQSLVADLVAASLGSGTGSVANRLSQPSSAPTTAPTVSATGGGTTGGFLAAGTYYIQYTFTGPFGETWGSGSFTGATPVSFTIAAGNIPRVTLPALPTGATAISIYLTASGGAAGTEVLYASGVTTTTYNLAVAAPGGSAVPLSATQIAGTVTATATASNTSYRGDVTGDVYEQYTIQVTTASSGNNATLARLSVRSASGRDDVASVTPAAFGSAMTIGTRGLTVTFVSAGDLIVGQTWVVAVRQAWQQPVATWGGTYTGTEIGQTYTYTLTVTRGGRYTDSLPPQVTVTRNDGTVTASPVTIGTVSTAVPLVSGITVSFAANGATPGLAKGDAYQVILTTATYGAYFTLVTVSNLPTAFQSGSYNLALGITSTFDVPAQQVNAPPALNWVSGKDSVTINAGITGYDPSFTSAGTPIAMQVYSGTVYAEYRSWLANKSGFTSYYNPSSTDPVALQAEVASILGTVDPANPLAYGIWKAAINCNKAQLLYYAVSDPTDLSTWQEALASLINQKNINTVVPLSNDPNVLAAYSAHVTAQSADTVGGEWRSTWISPSSTSVIPIVNSGTTSDKLTALATATDDPTTVGTQYTVITVPAGNAQFVSNGVQYGDTVRYNFGQNAFGQTTWSEYTVSAVVNQDTLLLVSGPATGVSTPQRVEVWRSLTRQGVANNWAALVSAGTGRERFVWPPTVEADGLEVPGYFLAAALAAYATSVAPHQSLRNLQFSGFSGVSMSTTTFNNAQLNTLADAGAIVVNQAINGQLYVQTAHTPNQASVTTAEEVVWRSADAVRYLMYLYISNYFGQANNTPTAAAMIRGDLNSGMSLLKSGVTIPRLGPVVQDITLVSLIPSPVLQDRLIATFTVTQTYPLNQATITLII